MLLALADCARESGVAWPSVEELKRKTGLGDRAVQAAVIDLAKLGELEVGYQEGPKGCNRYRLLMPPNPADIAGAQSLRGAENAGLPQDSRGPEESSQANEPDPAFSAPPAENAPPPQNSTPDPAESADGTVRDPSKEPKKPSRRRNLSDGREDAMRLCVHLADRIEGHGSLRPKITKDWLDAARLMIDTDHRSEQQVTAAIDWCQDSDWWKSRVMSMPKLRKQYDVLRLQAHEERQRRQNGSGSRRPSTTDRAVADAQALKADLSREHA